MMAILHPVKLVIDNYPEGQVEYLTAPNNLENEALEAVRFPSAKSFTSRLRTSRRSRRRNISSLFPGNEVRLMNAYFVTCTGCEKDENGNITVIQCHLRSRDQGRKRTGRQKSKRYHSLGKCFHRHQG